MSWNSPYRSHSPEYESWAHMLDRCNNPNNGRYPYYGGRGITVCERWTSFENFFADMGARSHGTSIERVNNDIGYSPVNCKWGTPTEQNRNKGVYRTNKSGVNGVSKHSSGKQRARLTVNGREVHLGLFDTVEEAAAARKQAEQTYWGRAA